MKKLDVFLAEKKTVGISGHVRPDGDCTGSCLATYNYIRKYYPEIEVDLYLEPIPNKFEFLKNAEMIDSEYKNEIVYDLFIALDCGDIARLGQAAKYFEQAKETLCIDHHVSNDSFADTNYIDPKVSSASELVYEMLIEEKITPSIAECIYLGMVHDTGVFQYSSTSAKTMGIAGKLMESGIDFSKIVDETFYTKSFEQNRILGQALLKSQLHLDGKCITSVITKQEMDEFAVLPKHLDGIVNQLRITRGVEVSVFLYQNEEQGYKVSMRSNGLVDVAKIAMQFNGGGHVRAAGVSMEGTAEEIVEKILDQIKEQIA